MKTYSSGANHFNFFPWTSHLTKVGVKKLSAFRQDVISRPGLGNPIKSSRTVHPYNDSVAAAAGVNESPRSSGSSNDSKHSAMSDTKKLAKKDSKRVAEASKPTVCDKCDGKHETSDCPYYRKDREKHPDAQKNADKKLGGTSKLPGAIIRHGRVARQPGDGSCLFHSLSYGLRDGSNASSLRREICNYINRYPNMRIADTPLSDWIKWDSGGSVGSYTRKMSGGAWGGGIEMASVSMMKDVNVHVYERSSTGFVRISAFDHPTNPESKKTVRVLYCGGVHYGEHPSHLLLLSHFPQMLLLPPTLTKLIGQQAGRAVTFIASPVSFSILLYSVLSVSIVNTSDIIIKHLNH
jgi:hypothetical protein